MDLLIICLLIFFSRILDVSLGTIRTILTVRGNRLAAAAMGFAESLLWFLVVRKALSTEETSIMVAISFSAGFATGTFVGGFIAKLMLPSSSIIQVITSQRDNELLRKISEAGFPMTISDVYGRDHVAEKYMLFITVSNRYLSDLKKIIIENDKTAFISISEGRSAINGQLHPIDKRK